MISTILPQDLSQLEKDVLDKDGQIKILPYKYYKQYSFLQLRYFMHKHAVYCLPTQELIDWFEKNITGKTIEIGAGNGAIARALKITATDSHLQTRPDIKSTYQAIGQPTINYGNDVVKLEAIEAIKKYKPHTVIGSYITETWNGKWGNYWGIDEDKVLALSKKYIMVGSLGVLVHKDKKIRKFVKHELWYDWLITRSEDKTLNRIFIWGK